MTIFRLCLSIVAISAFTWINFFLNAAGTLIGGEAAVHQFDNSATSYLVATPLTQFAGHLGLSSIFLLIVLALIWLAPLKRLWSAIATGAIVALLFASPHPAQAYYDKYDYTEAVYVLPNQSAFFVPDVGANKDTQAQFGSQEYYDQNKVASKRVLIPHAKLVNSGAWSDYYVPSARVILVTRLPYNNEWVTDPNRGTANKNEGYPCNTKDGLNLTTGINIGVSVSEAGAAKYLYHFGTEMPAGDPRDPAVIFTSVYYARPVKAVMDTIGHGAVGQFLCDEISARTLMENNGQAGAIIKSVREKATAYFDARGITVDFLGWGDTFDFDKAVQKAINDLFAANLLAPALPTLQGLAEVQVKEGLGQGLATHGLPANLLVLTSGLSEFVGQLIKSAPAAMGGLGDIRGAK